MTLAAEDWHESHDNSALAHIERGLIGTFLIFPAWLDHAALLVEKDFNNRFLGIILTLMKKFPKRCYDGLALAKKLEDELVPCPESHGWVATLAGYMDRNCLCEEEDVIEHVRIVKEAAARRRMGA